MVQNRNKLIELCVGNLANAVVHKLLEEATKKDELVRKYGKESVTSLEIAKKYREKINPKTIPLSEKDSVYIKKKVEKRTRAELVLRIRKGYENVPIELVEEYVNKLLKELSIA